MAEQKKEDICSIYEAACLTKLSPELLEWFTKFAPKHKDKRKLQFYKKEGDLLFFERSELFSFNNWLKTPWPKPADQQRPNIPEGIKREVIAEANMACAMCNSYRGTCEIAHIDPVHKSLNNHPDNLIFLCSNHHTAFDKGIFIPIDKEFVANLKDIILRRKCQNWSFQKDISIKLITVLETCSKLLEQLKSESTPEHIKTIELIAKETLSNIPKLAPVSESDPKYADFIKIQKRIEEVSGDSQASVKERLVRTRAIKQEYTTAYGFVACPLCKGSGIHGESECPVCFGDKEIEEQEVKNLDLSVFEKVECPLCRGDRTHLGEDCPVCEGVGELEKRYSVEIDLREYDLVACPVCKGKARYNGDYCRACNGEGELEQRYADEIDLRDYALVPCPLCKGERRHNGEDCRVCYGEGQIEQRYADEVDLSQYSLVPCRLCDGEGRYRGENCPVCDGNGEIEKGYADEVDLSQYSLVPCPLCKGRGQRRGDDCPVCDGNGEIEKGYADEVDLSQYSLVPCPLCKGRGQRRGDDCRACDGNGKIEKRYRD